ncbi:hypothetical protein PG996_002895 [Apiospora saccharicola]|uniref:F-box domain-containing protein n=1 Tax=Apiospora saccharicola TaxID=335842 RepID=A0ABR1WKQ8_9PEZI
MFCTICGCPICPPPQRPSEGGVEGVEQQQPEEEEQPKWLEQAVMLSDPAEEFETLEMHYRAGKKPGVPELEFTHDDQEIQRDEVTMATPDECILTKDGTRVRPNWGVGLDNDGQRRHPDSTPYGIVVHAACLDVVERVMRKRSRRRRCLGGGPSLRTLWKVLRMRLDTCDNELMGRTNWSTQFAPLWLRNFFYQYLTPTEFTTGDRWRISWREDHGKWVSGHRNDGIARLLSPSRFFALRKYDWILGVYGVPTYLYIDLTVVYMQLLEDPTTIPDLTNILLSNIKRVEVEAVDQETQAFRNAFMSLPLELRDHILDLLSSCDDLHLFCTRLLPQESWRDMLLGKKCLSFLYDIDGAAVLRFAQTKEEEPDANTVDWESLVRSLSRGVWTGRGYYQPPDYGYEWDFELPKNDYYYCDLQAAPAGLRNRRRIWQLVEEMFVGDALPSKGSGASVPRYWDEYGGRVYPVVRLSANKTWGVASYIVDGLITETSKQHGS